MSVCWHCPVVLFWDLPVGCCATVVASLEQMSLQKTTRQGKISLEWEIWELWLQCLPQADLHRCSHYKMIAIFNIHSNLMFLAKLVHNPPLHPFVMHLLVILSCFHWFIYQLVFHPSIHPSTIHPSFIYASSALYPSTDQGATNLITTFIISSYDLRILQLFIPLSILCFLCHPSIHPSIRFLSLHPSQHLLSIYFVFFFTTLWYCICGKITLFFM